jgi:AraC-like DNA-binding protein
MQIRQAAPSDRPATAAPGVVALEFAECDQFAEAIRHEDIEVVQTVGGRFSNQIFLIPLAGALVRYGCHQSPWLCSATALPGHVSVVLDAVSEGPTLQNGQAIYEAQALGLYGSGAEHVSRSSPGEYFYAPFSEARFQAAWQAATGQETPIRADEFRRVRPEGRRWQALLELIAALRRQAEHAPDAFHDPIIRGAVERSLLSAVVLAVAADQDRTKAPANRTSTRSRFALVRRAQEHLRAHAHQPVYVLDLCAATGVSERTLRDAFLEQCGMGPIRYLKLRRLHEVRRTLRATAPETTSVKAVALANGFWELGRFAVDYRQSFGESPSQTLQRAARPIE